MVHVLQLGDVIYMRTRKQNKNINIIININSMNSTKKKTTFK